MENADMLVVSAQGVLTLGVAIIGYFLRRLIDRSDQLEIDVKLMHAELAKRLQDSETDTNKSINKVRERAIRLEAHGQNYEEKLQEVKAKLDSMCTDIVWIRERLASRQ